MSQTAKFAANPVLYTTKRPLVIDDAALSGAFFGVNNGGWTFYSQVSSGVAGQEKKFFGLGKTVNMDLWALCVMGPPAQMWPDVTGTYTV